MFPSLTLFGEIKLLMYRLPSIYKAERINTLARHSRDSADSQHSTSLDRVSFTKKLLQRFQTKSTKNQFTPQLNFQSDNSEIMGKRMTYEHILHPILKTKKPDSKLKLKFRSKLHPLMVDR